MSAKNVHDLVPVKEPARYFTVPGFDTVIVWYLPNHGRYGERDVIEYAGTPEALLASGAVIPDMLVMNKRSGPRIRRKESDGCRWRTLRSWRHTRDGVECAPYPWFRITRPVGERLDRMPFGPEAFAAHEAWHRWDQAQRAADRAEERRGPQLRLVIDNTRPEVRS